MPEGQASSGSSWPNIFAVEHLLNSGYISFEQPLKTLNEVGSVTDQHGAVHLDRPVVICRAAGYGLLWGGVYGAAVLLVICVVTSPPWIVAIWLAWIVGAVIGMPIGLAAGLCLAAAPRRFLTSMTRIRLVLAGPSTAVPAVVAVAWGHISRPASLAWLGVFCLVAAVTAAGAGPRIAHGKRRHPGRDGLAQEVACQDQA